MNLQIGDTTLTVEYAQPQQFSNGKLVLNVEILKDNTTFTVEELVKLFEENTTDLIRTDDSGKTMVLAGFRQTVRGSYEDKTITTDGVTTTVKVYKIVAECVSAAEFQNQRYQARVTEVEAVNAALANEIVVLEEANAMQVQTIESMLLDIIPATIAEAIDAAFANQNATDSTTTEETVVEE